LRIGRSKLSWFGSRALCALLLIGLLAGNQQLLHAQQETAPQKKLPSAEKIVDGYLKAIGGKKRVATIRDATYEWRIQLKDQPMGIAKTQTKTPASVRSELIFGNGQSSRPQIHDRPGRMVLTGSRTR